MRALAEKGTGNGAASRYASLSTKALLFCLCHTTIPASLAGPTVSDAGASPAGLVSEPIPPIM